MKNLLFLIILFGFFSCTESTPNTENTTTTKDSIYEPTHNEYESEKTKNPITIRETSSTNEPFDTTVIVNINDIDIVLNGEKSIFYSDSEYEDYNVIQSNDTIYLSEWMSSGLNFVKVANQNENTYQVQQAYMTSMYILDDGKVFELENWKHHHSKWMNCWMTTQRTNTHGYSEFDNLNFPEYSQTELMEAVENCFYYSEDRMKSYKQLLSNPKYAKQMLHTFISSTIFKITDLEKDKTVYVVLKHYYGC